MGSLSFQQNRVLYAFSGFVCMIAFSLIQSRLRPLVPKALLRNMGVERSTPFDLPCLLNTDIETTSEGLTTGHFTSVDLVQAFLARIEEASYFNAVLQINPDALITAQHLDDERIHSGSRGPLHGIPILVKDNIATKHNLDVSAGSFALLGSKPATESSLISRLRAAGILVLGKTNLSEWANFRGLKIRAGWSPRGGQTRGTYYPNSISEGSSSGSAVATALGLCTAALGTETMGSIIDPAQINNVVGFKPTRGLIGTDGAIPISKRQDVIGTLTRSVKDAAYMLSNMAGCSELDPMTWQIPFEHIPDFTAYCKGTDLKGVTIGVPRNTFNGSSCSVPLMDSFESALRTLSSAGAKVVDGADFPAADEFKKLNQQVKGIVRSSEFRRDIVDYLAALETNPNDIHSVEDMTNFTRTTPAEEFAERDRDIGKFLWTQAEGIDVHSDKYKHMVEQELYFGGAGGILGAIEKYKLDVLATPSGLGIANDLAAKMGFPVITVPLGFHPEGTAIEYDSGGLVTVAPGMPLWHSLLYRILLRWQATPGGICLRATYSCARQRAIAVQLSHHGTKKHRAEGSEISIKPNAAIQHLLQSISTGATCTSPLVESPISQDQVHDSFQHSDGLSQRTILGWAKEC